MQPSCIGLDPEGFIRPAADGKSISPPYQPVVDALRASWYHGAGLPHAPTIQRILQVAQDPNTDAARLATIMFDFGWWLAERYRALKLA